MPDQETAYHLAIVSGLPFQAFPLHGTVIAGRLPEAGVRLDHPEVSRQHCKFEPDETGYRAIDLRSRSGTKVNNKLIAEPTSLKPGDVIELGPITLRFEIGTISELAAPALEPKHIRIGGLVTSAIPLRDGAVLGRDDDADVVLNDAGVSRRHAQLKRTQTGWKVIDLKSTAGAFVNGQRFDEHNLVLGDRLDIGPYQFEFDGTALVRVHGDAEGDLQGRSISYRSGATKVLHNISLHVAAGTFAGIIGPSGAGKSSLLHILSGLRPATSGEVILGNRRLGDSDVPPLLGFVPQEDIVHQELSVVEGLRFAAELRLLPNVPPLEVQKLLLQTMKRLGLIDRAGTRISDLSGGERKRVSVAAELMSRPPILFLDEPTSGLDPATEFKLMELLRDLADGGCTIVATTHVMENVYLMDQLLVVNRGRLLFSGAPQDVRNHFGVAKLSSLYDRLPEISAEDSPTPPAFPSPPGSALPSARPAPRRSPLRTLGILLRRELAILKSDLRNFAMLLSQPLLVGVLVSWASDDASLILFFAYLAVLWFGCSNGAQEIVSELAIYRRERVVGVGRHAYILSKIAVLGGVTLLQAIVLYATIEAGERGLAGAAGWQCLGLAIMAWTGAAIGCAISALTRTVMQAVLAVPLLLIPLILFSGHPVPANEMKPGVHSVSRCTPTFSVQRLMDVSFLWKQKIAHDTLSDHWTSFRNLNRDGTLKTGQVYAETGAAISAISVLLVWFVAAYGTCFLALRARERS